MDGNRSTGNPVPIRGIVFSEVFGVSHFERPREWRALGLEFVERQMARAPVRGKRRKQAFGTGR